MNGDGTLDVQSSLTDEEIRACLTVIKEGDAVNLKFAERELPEAVLIALKRDGQEIVGVGAVKRKRPRYASKIAERSGYSFDKNLHELGYVSVKESHQRRGLSYQIAAKLLSVFRDRPIFATTSNNFMKRTLKKVGFVQRGKEWEGNDGGSLSLWLKDADAPN